MYTIYTEKANAIFSNISPHPKSKTDELDCGGMYTKNANGNFFLQTYKVSANLYEIAFWKFTTIYINFCDGK